MKKLSLVFLVTVIALIAFVGCGDNSSDSEANTVATKLLEEFKKDAKSLSDSEAIATALTNNGAVSDLNMVTMPVEEGYLNGFNEEIHGFTRGTMFAPMIGSIPFVGYVFETDSPDALVENLESHGILNWNICTAADEMVVEKSGNYVFFVMAPNSFDDF